MIKFITTPFILAFSIWVLATSSFASQCYADPKLAYQALISEQTAQKVRGERVNINTASAGELATLKGVGAKTAVAIVEYREMFGWFESVDDLTKVKGVGEATLEKNRHRLTVY